MKKLHIQNGYMQLIASSVLVSNQGAEKYGFGTIKGANPQVQIHPRILGYKTNITGFSTVQKYRYVGDIATISAINSEVQFYRKK